MTKRNDQFDHLFQQEQPTDKPAFASNWNFELANIKSVYPLNNWNDLFHQYLLYKNIIIKYDLEGTKVYSTINPADKKLNKMELLLLTNPTHNKLLKWFKNKMVDPITCKRKI